MRRYALGAHAKTDLKVHLVWIPKYRKRVLKGEVAVRTRDILRQIAIEHELEVITGKVSIDHVQMFIAYRPTQNISKVMQWLKGISSRVLLSKFPHLKRQLWGRHFWARGYLAVSSGNITDEMTQKYIDEQEGEGSSVRDDVSGLRRFMGSGRIRSPKQGINVIRSFPKLQLFPSNQANQWRR